MANIKGNHAKINKTEPASASTPDVCVHIYLVNSTQTLMGSKPKYCTSFPLALDVWPDLSKPDNNQQRCLYGG